jgi:hypothetical protein
MLKIKIKILIKNPFNATYAKTSMVFIPTSFWFWLGEINCCKDHFDYFKMYERNYRIS